MSLFPDAYSGKVLSVSWGTHMDLRLLFPELNERDEYRDADAWLFANPMKRPKQKGTKRFLINWFRKSEKQRLREERKSLDLRRELRVGANEWRQR